MLQKRIFRYILGIMTCFFLLFSISIITQVNTGTIGQGNEVKDLTFIFITYLMYGAASIYGIYKIIQFKVFKRLEDVKIHLEDPLEKGLFEFMLAENPDEIGELEASIVEFLDILSECSADREAKIAEYSSLVEDMPVIIVRYKPDGTIVFANNHFYRTSNVSNINELIAPKYLTKTKYSYLSLTKEEPISCVENEIRGKDGKNIWTKWTNRAIFDNKGRVLEFQSIGVDISYRKQIEKRLEEHERQLSVITDNMSDLVVQLDLAGNYMYISPSYQRVLTRMPKLGDSIYEFVHPDDLDLLKKTIRRAIKKEVVDKIEYRTKNGAGDYVWIEVIGSVLYDEDKSVIGVILSGRNITERKHIKNRLRYQLAFQELIALVSTDLVRAYNHDIDTEIENTLSKVGEFLDVDRAYIWIFNRDLSAMHSTHEWCRPGVTDEKKKRGIINTIDIPWFMERLKRYEVICVDKLQELKKEAAKEQAILDPQGVVSLLVIPLRLNGSLLGYMGFDSLDYRTWQGDDINMLEILSRLIGSILRENLKSYEVGD